MDCTEIQARPIMQQIVRVESGGNPFAIGVVGNQLVRQPKTLEEAVATVKALSEAGWNFSIGKGQVNKIHFPRLGWTTDIASGFDVCKNIVAAAEIYENCFTRAVKAGYSVVVHTVAPMNYSATHAALSCYYSGDFLSGGRLGYVAKVLNQGSKSSGGVPVPLAHSVLPASMMID